MAETAVATRPLTFDDVRQFDPDELPGELENGEWIPVSRPTPRHGEVMAQLAFLLKCFLMQHPIGRVSCGDPGVELTHDPDTLRGPDVIFVANERLEDKMPDDWLESAPDLAVEIVSKSQSFVENALRARDLLAAGSRAAWVIDPKSRTVAVFTEPDRVRFLQEEDELDGGEVLPGFRCRVAQLFE